MSAPKIEITSEWLRYKLADIETHHQELFARYGEKAPHHGIVPDLILEILRLRGEEVPELSYPHFPQFVVKLQ